MDNFDGILNEIEENLKSLVRITLRNYVDQAEIDIQEFLKLAAPKLQRWMRLVFLKELSYEELEWLVASQKELLVLQGLKQNGVSKIRLDQFQNSVLNIIIDTIISNIIG